MGVRPSDLGGESENKVDLLDINLVPEKMQM